ncbi:MAG: cupin-like domain-containing protein [Candidatus Sericytochromatia bacterium]|nr:cupin-like domain-containing protein [Candidatus Sericytochromatia bacterium]
MPEQDSLLAALLAPFSSAVFAREIFGQKPLYLAGQDHPEGPEHFAELFDWQALNDLLNFTPRLKIRIHHQGLNYFYTPGAEQLGEAVMRLRQGGTLILERVDQAHGPLARFADALSDEIATPVQINLYLSYPGHAGYPAHYDLHDFFILQIAGQKLWDVYPATMPNPLDVPASFKVPGLPLEPHAQAPDDSQKLLQALMQPGDLLYVPKGFWHKALAQHSPSLHLTVGLRKHTGLDLTEWLLQHLRESEVLRQTLPLTHKEDLPHASGQTSPYQAAFDRIREALTGLLQNPELLARFHQDTYLSLERRQGFELPQLYLQDAVELQPAQHFVVRRVPHKRYLNPRQMLELSFPRNTLFFAAAAEPLLHFVLERSHFSGTELQQAFPDHPWPALAGVLLPLVQEGLLVVAAGEEG